MIVLPPDFWVRVRSVLWYAVVFGFTFFVLWWGYGVGTTIWRVVNAANDRSIAAFYARPDVEWFEQKYRYFNVKYTVIKIDDKEYLMFMDTQDHVTAICPKQK